MNCKVCVAVIALLAVACNGLYNLRQKNIDACDLSVVVGVFGYDPSMYGLMNFSLHGNFISTVEASCSSYYGQCNVSEINLYRPDLAETYHVAKRFMWAPSGKCYDDQVEANDFPDLRGGFDLWFMNREIAMFHGIKCYKYYNETTYVAYGNDMTGDIYGLRYGDYDYIYNITTPRYQPYNFMFDEFYQSGCSYDAYSTPAQKIWDYACHDYSSASSESSWFTPSSSSWWAQNEKEN